MAIVKHFSHDHPLISFVDGEVDDNLENEKPYLCSICGLPILSSPSYTCSNNSCNFFLHKPCAQLPEELNHPNHKPEPLKKHTLHLKPKSSTQNFTYRCEKCEFELHPLVAKPVEIKTKHNSHQPHPLEVIRRETLCLCDACGEEHKGFFFSCQECCFWIHQDCTLLPSIVKLSSHEHPFILAFSLPSHMLYRDSCLICNGLRDLRYGVGLYYCGECHFFAHVNCAKSRMENLKTECAKLGLIQLPEEGDTFPSWVIRRYLESNPLTQHDEHNEKYHEHPLVLDDGVLSRRGTSNLVCDICIQPINTSSPFYRCLDCYFLAHDICADHLCKVKFPFEDYVQTRCPDPSKLVFNSVFFCFLCHRPSNGLCYYWGDDFPLGLIFEDPECMAAPNMIKHASHRQHVLFLATRSGMLDDTTSTSILSCCSGASYFVDVYRCFFCNYQIHYRCALLPKKTQHNEFDEHSLVLIMNKPNKDDEHNDQWCCFCEVCEKVIDHKYWYYGCDECEQYFHINCIPSVGHLSKVKFEKPFVDNNIHHHALTLTRMLTIGKNEMCRHCNQIIRGLVDEMAFRCSHCDFWIHFSCARDCSIAPRLKLYSEVERECLENLKQAFE